MYDRRTFSLTYPQRATKMLLLFRFVILFAEEKRLEKLL